MKLACSSTAKTALSLVTVFPKPESTLVRTFGEHSFYLSLNLSASVVWGTLTCSALQFNRLPSRANADHQACVEPVWKELGWTHIRSFLTDIGPENTALIQNIGIGFYDASPSGNPSMLLYQ